MYPRDATFPRQVLAAIQHAGSIRNHDLESQTAASLQELTELGSWTRPTRAQGMARSLSGQATETASGSSLPDRHPVQATLRTAGGRARGLAGGPGQPPLVERGWRPAPDGAAGFPCPADELAAELQQIGQRLLVQARIDDTGAIGQSILGYIDKALGGRGLYCAVGDRHRRQVYGMALVNLVEAFERFLAQ
jgi:hypothetical protein